MTTNESAQEEHPWGFEREPDEPSTVEKWKFDGKLDALSEKVDQLTVPMKDVARAAMEGLKAAMGNLSARGPDPDAAPQDDDIRRLASVIERLAQRPPSSDYNEAPKPEGNLKAVVIGCTVTIVSAGIIGVIVLSNNFSALRAEFTEWKTATEYRLQQLERRP